MCMNTLAAAVSQRSYVFGDVYKRERERERKRRKQREASKHDNKTVLATQPEEAQKQWFSFGLVELSAKK